MSRKNKLLPSQDDLDKIFCYDKLTGLLTWRKRTFNSKLANGWNTRYANKSVGVKNSQGYLTVSINNSRYLVHRIVWKLLKGTEPLIVDHIDGDRLNNRVINLREATESLSAFNKRLTKKRLPRGVQPNKYGFMARLANKYIGTYKTPKEAHQAYCIAVAARYGAAPTAAFPNE